MSQYPVITSRAAKKDYSDIQVRHGDLLMGMAMQSQKAMQNRQQKASEMASKNSMKNEIGKSKQVANSPSDKISLNFAEKTAEIDVRRANSQ